MTLDTTALPEPLAAQAQKAWEDVLDRAGADLAAQLTVAAAGCAAQLGRIVALSPFVADLSRRRPALLLELLGSGDLARSLHTGELQEALETALADPDAEAAVVLRRFRARHMLRILWRDLNRSADTLETVRDASDLADACIRGALAVAMAEQVERFGMPVGASSGEPQALVVLAMGKLGAHELNVSSDIDLMFAFPESGQTQGTTRSVSNEEFFTRVGQSLIALLDATTGEGFVFRVDMRLRPYGESGALVHNFTALEEYYQDQGRDWERYALIKARAVTGDPARAAQLMTALKPFVFRRYVDFSVIDSLRGMKRMINTEVRRRGLDGNVKLGHGGIREVEFIAQCFQLIRGGRDLGLQQRELLPVLEECAALNCLPEQVVAELRAAYLFLRDTEHAIQGWRDQQTQELPTDDLPRLALAVAMGFDDWESFSAQLAAHRERVSGHFAMLIEPPEEEADTAAVPADWGAMLSEASLAEMGYCDVEGTLQELEHLRDNPRVATLQAEGRARLDQFMPRLLAACAESEAPDIALTRLLPFVVAVVRRSAYLVLLLENPPALGELVTLCGASPWIAEQLARNPVLLDELLDRASLYSAPDKDLLRRELQAQVARLDPGDLEAQMDTLRYFKASHVLRVAASELTGRLPLMQVSDKLSFLAEVILEQVLAVAWADLTAKYGEPSRDSTGTGFAVYGYGKLGGIELGHGSDLDLVFLFDAAATGYTNGERPVDNVVFYTRLGQRMIHILETRMPMGQLYEVDMRLRPSGESGMLVAPVAGFRSYQMDDAWTWEHQALVRARFVAGDEQVAGQVDAVRTEVLCQAREEAALAREVQAMRNRMREHLLPDEHAKEGEFHLKQGSGGIVDIEFMVQYAVLAWSHREPELARWSDNVRILETLGRKGFFEQQECETLTQAYLAYRSAAHQLSLQQQPGVVPADRFAAQRNQVSDKWRQLFAPYPLDSSPLDNETEDKE